jgi:hypothetical protein
MRFTKVFGLAAIAAVAAMAVIAVSSAAAADTITICKKLVTGSELCPTGELLGSGGTIEALAKNPELVTSIGTEKCEDSTITGTVNAGSGATLPVTLGAPAFGVLPTPTLGTGCTGPCTGGVHALALENSSIGVEAEDKFFLKASGLAFLLECNAIFFTVTCAYRGENKVSKIDRDVSTHPRMEGKFDLILVETVLTRVTTHGGSSLCPETSEWKASYTVTGCKTPGGVATLCWIALDKE